MASAKLASAPPAATIAADMAHEVTKVLVAATLSSGPAISGRQRSASRASGEASSLVTATVGTPARLASAWKARMSGLCPDWDVVTSTVPRRRSLATVLVTTSQSGQSPDILAFQAEAKRAGVPTVAVTNDEASPLARDADLCLPLMAGPELSVAATKTFVTSCAMSAAMVAAGGAEASFAEAIAALPADLAAAQALRWTKLEESAVDAGSLYVLGRGPSLPIAQEAALKLKE